MKYKSQMKSYQALIQEINRQRSSMEGTRDRWLKEKSRYLKEQVRKGAGLDAIMVEAFALVCEASRRVLEMQPYDVQIAAGIAMHRGSLVEMQTGEGKTLAAVLPAYLNALTGKGVHILTFNDYLARRDAAWMGPVYRFLGLSVAPVQEGMSIYQRKEAYASDIVYITAREAGFDFLRDQRCLSEDHLVHRPFNYTIVDEADSLLIDEARVPLVVAGETAAHPFDPHDMARRVRRLIAGGYYYFDEYSRDVNFSDEGMERLEALLGRGHLHTPENNPFLSGANLALQAELLLKRDIDYIIRDGKIELVDAFTGRVAENRRWPYGLQTAIEAKEDLEIQPEGMILGSITLQHFLKLYPKVAGMTATAKTSAEEFENFYQLEVVVIPPNKPCIREDLPDVVFTHKAAKAMALLAEIGAVHATGRPILVGTASVEESEELAALLKGIGIHCVVLNAKNDEKEAAIVAEAGALKAVTISTNMAGRGTDIRLGGKDQRDYDRVVALGGLYVIGANRHESRRIDNQLRGRAGRQGDPGSSCFFISLEDEMMVRYHIDELIPKKYLPQEQDGEIRHPVIAREIARAQRIVEGQNYEIRKTLFKYSFLVEEQRKILQGQRMDLLVKTDNETFSFLEQQPETSERCARLLQEVGKPVLEKVEKQLTLYYIDDFWTRHLDYLSHIREGIHLLGVAGKDPSFEFQKMAVKAFSEMQEEIDDKIIESFNRAVITKKGIDEEKEGMKRPSATWTYLINDIPFANPLHQVLISSNAFAFGAALMVVQNLPLLPLILIGRLLRRLWKKARGSF
jgi:preprotein translocase subunit SecA